MPAEMMEPVGRLAQVVLQDSQRAGDDHPLDATAINGDGYVFAEWFHGEISPFVSSLEIMRGRIQLSHG